MTVKSEARGVGTAGKSWVIYNKDVDSRALKHVGFSFPLFSREASPLMSSESPWVLGTGLQ